MRAGAAGQAAAPALPRLQQAQDHAERYNVGAGRVGNVEAFVLEPSADVADVHLRTDAPGELGAVVGEREEAAGRRVAAAARAPALQAELAEHVEVGHR